MRTTVRAAIVFALTAVFSLMTAGTAQAFGSEVDNVLACLAREPLCVDATAKSVSSEQAARIRQTLTSDDRIIIVVLPDGYLQSSGENLPDIALQLDDATEHSRIIGLAADDQVFGYSSLLPAGVATDLMSRSQSISANTAEALRLFIREVHSWQSDHPDWLPASPQPLEAEPPDANQSAGVGPIIGFTVGGAIGLAIVWIILRRTHAGTTGTQFTAPRKIRRLQHELMELRDQIQSGALRDDITQLCRDLDEYFRRHDNRSNHRFNVELFGGHLRSARDVLKCYIDVQNNPRYFRFPDSLLSTGRGSIGNLKTFILDSVRHGSASDVDRYTVNTDILLAQRLDNL